MTIQCLCRILRPCSRFSNLDRRKVVYFMSSTLESSIKSVEDLLGKNLLLDYFQREYRWGEVQIEQLMVDLLDAFRLSYRSNHSRSDVADYKKYFLGNVVLSGESADGQLSNRGKQSIVDGQQRITTLTLLLVCLKHRQSQIKGGVVSNKLTDLIKSEAYGEITLNLHTDDRADCMESLFASGAYVVKDEDSETVHNLTRGYNFLWSMLSENLTDVELPFFIDWLLDGVVVSRIVASTIYEAYTIFETMNSRGLRLTSLELLKGYVLSQITDITKRTEIDMLWKQQVRLLKDIRSEDSTHMSIDIAFFIALFKAKYASNVGSKKVNDFDRLTQIGLYDWFKEKHESLLSLSSSDDFYTFFKEVFPFYVNLFIRIRGAMCEYTPELENLFYLKACRLGSDAQDYVLMSAVKVTDTYTDIIKKLNYLARYLEIYTYRCVFRKTIDGANATRPYLYALTVRTRNLDSAALAVVLFNDSSQLVKDLDYVVYYGVPVDSKSGRSYARHILARVANYVDRLCGETQFTYASYMSSRNQRKGLDWYELATIKTPEQDVQYTTLGNMLLLTHSASSSCAKLTYANKLQSYKTESNFVRLLDSDFMNSAPKALKTDLRQLGFKCYAEFDKKADQERTQAICNTLKQMWCPDYFTL